MTVGPTRAAEVAERRAVAIRLRRAGMPWDDVASQCGYSSAAAACKDVRRARQKALRDFATDVEEQRQEEIERLDRLQAGLWTSATKGDHRAADTVVRIIKARTELTGVSIPADAAAAIEEEVTARVGAKMATVWGAVLRGLDLTPEQSARIPGLLDAAIASFTGRAPQRAVKAAATAGEPIPEDTDLIM